MTLRSKLDSIMGANEDKRERCSSPFPEVAECPVTNCHERGLYTNCYIKGTMHHCDKYNDRKNITQS